MNLIATGPVIRLADFADRRTAYERNQEQARIDSALEAKFQQCVVANIAINRDRRARVVARIRTERGLA